MNSFGAVFSHMGARRAATSFQRGLGLAPAGYVRDADWGTDPIPIASGPSSAGDMTLPILGDVSSFMNFADSAVDLFARYNLSKRGKLVVTVPGGKNTPGISPGEPGGKLFGISSSTVTIGALAVGALVLYMVLK